MVEVCSLALVSPERDKAETCNKLLTSLLSLVFSKPGDGICRVSDGFKLVIKVANDMSGLIK
jgi:hypothetical protein